VREIEQRIADHDGTKSSAPTPHLADFTALAGPLSMRSASGLPYKVDQALKDADHPGARHARAHFHRESFAVALIDDIERSELSTAV
jgi:hypothetical protein